MLQRQWVMKHKVKTDGDFNRGLRIGHQRRRGGSTTKIIDVQVLIRQGRNLIQTDATIELIKEGLVGMNDATQFIMIPENIPDNPLIDMTLSIINVLVLWNQARNVPSLLEHIRTHPHFLIGNHLQLIRVPSPEQIGLVHEIVETFRVHGETIGLNMW